MAQDRKNRDEDKSPGYKRSTRKETAPLHHFSPGEKVANAI